MEARIVHGPYSMGPAVEITGLPDRHGESVHIFEGIEACRAKNLSNNELKETVRQIEKQLDEMGADNTPPSFVELFTRVKAALLERVGKDNYTPSPTEDAPGFLDEDLRRLWG